MPIDKNKPRQKEGEAKKRPILVSAMNLCIGRILENPENQIVPIWYC